MLIIKDQQLDLEAKEQKIEFDFEIKADEHEDGVFTGYASTFGNEDLDRDIIERGAFTKSIRRNKAKGIKMLWQHDRREPIGIWTEIKEDDHGIFVKGRLATKTTRGSDAYELMKIGALDKMSIGFMIKTYEIDRKKQVRIIKEGELFEISIVTFPANPQASVGEVKELQNVEIAPFDAEWDEVSAKSKENQIYVGKHLISDYVGDEIKIVPKALFIAAGNVMKDFMEHHDEDYQDEIDTINYYYEKMGVQSPFNCLSADSTLDGFKSSVRAYFSAAETAKDFEIALRDAGLSRKEAKTVVSVNRSQRDVAECDVSNALMRLNASFKK